LPEPERRLDVVVNRTRSRAEPLIAQGALAANSVADACHADVVITMLADDAAVEGVVFQSGGILSALPKNAIHVSMSTKPTASLVHDHYFAGVAQGQGGADWASLARLCARNAGL
jgi:hypothetical protein